MGSKPLKLLLVHEEEQDGGSFVYGELSTVRGFVFDLETVGTEEKALQFLSQNSADAVIFGTWASEEGLTNALRKIHGKFFQLPMIVLTEREDPALAVKLIETGAQDCLPKARANGENLHRIIQFSIRRKQSEQLNYRRLAAAGEQAQMATRAKTKFLAKMSHEIRNPLNAILGFSALLKKSKLGVRQAQYLETISSCGNLLLGICDDMLDISKIEAGQITLENTHFDLNRLIEDVFKMVKVKLDKKSLKLYFELESDVPTDLYGDAKKLGQILINLLNNAVKFTDQGEVALTVEIDRNRQLKDKNAHMLRFSVKDTGIGIPEDKKDLIFEMFSQAHYSQTHQPEGTGLGLAISRAFVEAMGGSIWFKSQEGKGSEFIFTAAFKEKELPLSGRPAALSLEEPITQRNIADKLDCKGLKILVAEDGIPSQDLIKAYFDYLGCEADYVTDGRQAIEKLRQGHYDACLMDMGMPVMDGIEATKVIRKEISKELPIIALTAAAMKKDEKRCLSAGMDDYIRKPVDVMRLKEKLLLHTKLKKTV
jgi:signal transduction histidine kinase